MDGSGSRRGLSPVLLIGGAGFVGQHLIRVLAAQNIDVFVTKLAHETVSVPCAGVFDLDILDYDSVVTVLQTVQPKAVVHLAAQSSVALSWKRMDLTFDVNVKGTAHLLNAVAATDPAMRVLMISSAEEYGKSGCERPNELTPVHPQNPYAISKAAQTFLAGAFCKAYGLDIVTMRAFNHIGPGQPTGFAVTDFCSQIADIERGKRANVMTVGNLDARRDFTDVRDIAAGYLLALQYGQSGEIYNIGSGKSVRIGDILDELIGFSRAEIHVETDQSKLRPSDTPVLEADISKFVRQTGYRPAIPLSVTLLDTLNDYRKKVVL